MKQIISIKAADLKAYTLSLRNVKTKFSSYELGLHATISFDFSEFFELDSVVLNFRRPSGNGHILLGTNSAFIAHNVVSQLNQPISVPVDIVKIIDIKRPNTAQGVVELTGIDLYTNNDLSEPMAEKKWKNILNRCKGFRHIKVVGDKLFASEGGEIYFNELLMVETNPPNSYVVKDNTIKFVISCEVTNLQFGFADPVRTVPSLFPHFDSNMPRAVNLQNIKAEFEVQEWKDNVEPSIKSNDNNVLFDSDKHDTSVFLNEHGRLDNGSVILSYRGSIVIPIEYLSPNSEYIAVIEANNVIGNGKIFVSLEGPDGKTVSDGLVVCHGTRKFFNVRLRTGREERYNLRIERTIAGTGDISIGKFLLISSVFQSKYKESIKLSNLPKHLSPAQASSFPAISKNKDRKFVIVIPSYKNVEWVERNLISALTQNYPYYRVIFVDDNSPDETYSAACKVVEKLNAQLKTTIIANNMRKGALHNLYDMIQSCADDEIVLTLDGDDWLAHENVLNVLNDVYKSGDVWLTYGQYRNHPDGGNGICTQIPNSIIGGNNFRVYTWCASHLRTFYAWMFKAIRKEDFMYDGGFLTMTWDFAMMFPMLEMAGHHSQFISEQLYIYNMENPINDHKVNRGLQAKLDGVMRGKQRYSPVTLKENMVPKTKIGLILIATNKYERFVNPIISSADRYFFNKDNFDVTYFVFSDKDIKALTNRNVEKIFIEHKPFPYATMDRFKHFTNNELVLRKVDYLYYVDVDCLFVNNVAEEILGELVGVRHCGYYGGGGTFETNVNSQFYLPHEQYKHYYGGGFSGGKTDEYLKLSKWCYEHIEKDLANGIMPLWHDETAVNKYFADHEPLSLSPSYHYPQGNIEHYKSKWNGENFEPKILLLDKDHKEARSD